MDLERWRCDSKHGAAGSGQPSYILTGGHVFVFVRFAVGMNLGNFFRTRSTPASGAILVPAD